MGFTENLVNAWILYWRAIFLVVYPLCLLPIFMINDNLPNRCIYCICLMVGYWVTQALPIPITCVIPVAFFPLMGVLSSVDTTICYLSEYSVIMVCAVMIALAMEMSTLDKRIAFSLLKWIGFSPRKMHIVFTFFTMFVSMFISSTATTSLVSPILLLILKEMEEQGASKIFEEGIEPEMDEDGPDEIKRQPTRSTMGLFISVAYASTIGGTGYLTGNACNIIYKDIFEKKYPDDYVNHGVWLMFCVPFMLITTIITFIIIEILYMGLFRPNSTAADEFKPQIDEAAAKSKMEAKLQEMGMMSFHEVLVLIFLIVAILLWFFRSPQMFDGWADLYIPYNTVVKDTTAGVLVIVIIFLVPKSIECIYTCSSDEEKKPKSHANGLVTWKYCLRKIPWSVLLLVGASFAIAEGSSRSGLSERMCDDLEDLVYHSTLGVFCISTIVGMLMTQLAPNSLVSATVLPVLANVSKGSSIHPEYIMWPTTIASQMAFLLEVSTPPNAIITYYIHLPTLELFKMGIITMIVSYCMILLIFGLFLPILIDINETLTEVA